ncbi:glycosyltransferase family 4 protein [Desulfobulbus marinus]|nr:glycosyltransferase family 4 protein [Desulfogranum marinum]
MTAATGGDVLDKKVYERIDKIVAESEYDFERLKSAGIQEEKLSLIYPGLDLNQFSYQEPEGDFSILFASSPFTKEYFEARGVNLLLSATEAFKNVSFTLLWRKWADTIPVIEPMVQDKKNVTLQVEHIKNISTLINNVHAVIAPFTAQQLTKPCPHSVIESLASGKPVLVTDKVGIAHIIEETQCGVVFKPNKDSLIAAIKELRTNYAQYQINARKCAETYFSQYVFLKQYESLYHELF